MSQEIKAKKEAEEKYKQELVKTMKDDRSNKKERLIDARERKIAAEEIRAKEEADRQAYREQLANKAT